MSDGVPAIALSGSGPLGKVVVPSSIDRDEGVGSRAYDRLKIAMTNSHFSDKNINDSIAKLEKQVNQLDGIGRHKYQIREWLVGLVCDQLKDPSGNFDVLLDVVVKRQDLKDLIKSDVTEEAYDKVIGNNDGKYDDAVRLGEFSLNIMKAAEFEGDISDSSIDGSIQGLYDLLGSDKIILVDEKDTANYFNTALNGSLSEHLQPDKVPPGNLQLLDLMSKKYSKSYLCSALVRVLRSGRSMSDNEARSRAGLITLCWFVKHDIGVGKYAYKIYSRGDKESDNSADMAEVCKAAFEWGFGWDKETSPENYLKGIYNGIKIEKKIEDPKNVPVVVPAGQPASADQSASDKVPINKP